MLSKLFYFIIAFGIGTIIGRTIFRILKIKRIGYRVFFQKSEKEHLYQKRYY